MPSAAPSKSELRLLRPLTRSATITPRPADYKSSSGGGLNVTGGTHYTPKTPDPGDKYESSSPDAINHSLSGDELYSKLKDKVKSHYLEIKQAFYVFDGNRSSFVSLSEFRKVVENFIFRITDSQFDQLVKQVDGIKNQAINYNQFLFRINKSSKRGTPTANIGRITPANLNLDNIVRKLQDKLNENGERITKAMRMFDVRLNGKISKSDLRRVLESFAFHISKEQFDKLSISGMLRLVIKDIPRLYRYYDITRDGYMDYITFLKSVVATTLPLKPASASPTTDLVIFEEQEEEVKAEKEPPPPLWCETVPLVEVEIKLRNKIKHRIQLLYRAFKSVDIHSEGYVTLQQLRRVLEKFTFPMTDKVYARLMERMDVNATNRIRYETFLYKFQDRRVGGFDQSIPIKPNHRHHPIIESSEEPSLEELMNKLRSKVVDGYNSVKQAFLTFDEDKSGKIRKRDFKNVIDGFCYRTTDAQFSKLMKILDPKKCGYVSYQQFFKLFDDSLRTEPQVWQTSEHSKTLKTQIAPLYLHDSGLITHLSKKINDDRKAVAVAFTQYDRDGNGSISKRELKNFLKRFNVPFSDEQFKSLMRRVTPNVSGGVNFYDVMKVLGVDLGAADVGVSAVIAQGNDATNIAREEDHRQKLEVVAQRAHDHTRHLPTDELIAVLRDYLHQRSAEMRNLFLRYDENNNGRIGRSLLRKFLLKAGFYVDDAQFKELCKRLNIGKYLSYQDFLECFQDQTNGIYSNDVKRVPKIVPGLPVTGISPQEGFQKLKHKLELSYRDLRAAFHAIDRDNDGLVNRTDLVSILTRLLLPMTGNDISELWRRIGGGKKRINVQQFVSVFEDTESPDAHRWLVSVYKTKEGRPSSQLKAHAVLNVFRMKALDRFSSLQKCFMYLDKDSKGRVSKKQFRQCLTEFGISIKKDEFLKFWKHYDTEGRGYIEHEQFILKTADEFTPGDSGVSKAIVEASTENQVIQSVDQMYRREDQLLHNMKTMRYLSNEELEKRFRTNIHHNYGYLRSAFKAIDKDGFGFLKKSDIRKILFDLHFLVDDAQLKYLISRCGLEDKKRINYKKFLDFFEKPQAEQKGSSNFHSIEHRIAPFIAAYPHISDTEAISRMRYCISEISDVLVQAFTTIDFKEYGTISVEDLKRVLDNFCYIMTDKQFKKFSKDFPYTSDGKVDFHEFIKAMSDLEGLFGIEAIKRDSREWLKAVLGKRDGKRSVSSLSRGTPALSRASRSKSCTNLEEHIRPSTAPFVSAEHVENRIDEDVKLNWMLLHKYYKQRSDARHTVSANVFRGGLEDAGIRLSEEDMTVLCNKYDSQNCGQINFTEFLKKHSFVGRTSRNNSRPGSRASDSQLSLRSARLSEYSYNLHRSESCDDMGRPETARSVSRSIASQVGFRRSTTQLCDLTPGPGIDPPYHVISAMSHHVVQHWKELRKQFTANDHRRRGWISTSTFRDVIRGSHMDIAEEDFTELIDFYKTESGGRVYYNDFLRAFLSMVKVD